MEVEKLNSCGQQPKVDFGIKTSLKPTEMGGFFMAMRTKTAASNISFRGNFKLRINKPS